MLKIGGRLSIEANLAQRLKAATPSLQISVLKRGQKIATLRWGQDYTFYDWASLTKVVFTVSLFMHLQTQKKLNISQKVVSILPWFPWPLVKIVDLLSHRAGMTWWQPFYKKLNLNLCESLRLEQLKGLLLSTKPSQSHQSVYSDIDFLLLRYVLEEHLGVALPEIYRQFQDSLHLGQAHFCEHNKPVFNRSLYAPTEDCPWRKRVMQGEVHDENTWALGGVSTHAGLFGTLEDLEGWALALQSGKFADSRTQELFLKRRSGDWAAGFMMPTKGGSSSGRYFSHTSVGHTGFTGTSFWWDRKRDVMILMLSNRVHPSRNNKLFVQLRPQLHDLVMEVLGYDV